VKNVASTAYNTAAGVVSGAQAAVQPHLDTATAAVKPHLDNATAAVKPHLDNATAAVKPHLDAATNAAAPHIDRAKVAATNLVNQATLAGAITPDESSTDYKTHNAPTDIPATSAPLETAGNPTGTPYPATTTTAGAPSKLNVA
jgi:hypothetical protein